MRYDSHVIHEVAERLYSAAAITEVISAIIGAIGGAGLGLAFASSFGSATIPILIAGIIVGGGLGFWIGHLRAIGLRFSAQMALCQAQIEENTRGNPGSGAGSFSGPRGTGNRIGDALTR
jgi:hypothetical protein